jgi:hypothetical protein
LEQLRLLREDKLSAEDLATRTAIENDELVRELFELRQKYETLGKNF